LLICWGCGKISKTRSSAFRGAKLKYLFILMTIAGLCGKIKKINVKIYAELKCAVLRIL